MRRPLGPSFLVLPDDLRAFAWSAPMRELASKLDLSDVGLRKLLVSYGVYPPPQGYWNKVRAGKRVPQRPSAPPRRAGETGRLRMDARFSKVLLPAEPLPVEGPFASAFIPEDLDDLYAQELKAIGRATVPGALDRVHPGLVELLEQERRRHDIATREWPRDEPKFDTPLARRRLRILDGIFKALSRRGHDGSAYERDGEIHAQAIIGDTRLGLHLEIAGPNRAARLYGSAQPDPQLPATTSLALRLRPNFGREFEQSWQDDRAGRLETKIAPIVAAVIVAGEATFRRSLREAVERLEQERVAQESRRREELAMLHRQRLQHLRESGEMLRQADGIRALVARVRQAIVEGGADISPPTLEAWEKWALAEADKIDPVRSGQVEYHLREPKL